MTDDHSYRVGRGKPPKHTQFTKGQSGNPGGRPRKPRRLPIPSQTARDVLRVRELPVSVKTAKGEEVLSLGEAIIFSVGKRALNDKVSFTREWLRLEERALQWQLESNAQLRLGELLQKILDEKLPDRDPLTEETLDALVETYKKLHR